MFKYCVIQLRLHLGVLERLICHTDPLTSVPSYRMMRKTRKVRLLGYSRSFGMASHQLTAVQEEGESEKPCQPSNAKACVALCIGVTVMVAYVLGNS